MNDENELEKEKPELLQGIPPLRIVFFGWTINKKIITQINKISKSKNKFFKWLKLLKIIIKLSLSLYLKKYLFFSKWDRNRSL